jgi:hypothetical protein
MATTFADLYPTLARWVTTHGWIEVGYDGMSPSFVRVQDEGGLIYEGEDTGASVDKALQAAEAAVKQWMKDELGE